MNAETIILGFSIFPGDVVTQASGGSMEEREFDNLRPNIADSLIPSLGTCIAYQDMGGGKFHYTPYNFSISSAIEGKSPIKVLLSKGIIPLSNVKLISVPIGVSPD